MIHFQDIQFRYEGTISSEIGVKDINLIVHTGECVLLCGRSGCGKTTLTKLINGLIPNYFPGELSGNVQIDDENILGMPMYYLATKVGSVFQNPRTQFFNVDVDSEIAFGIENIAVPPDELHQRLEYTLDSLKIRNLQGKNIFELSGGEKQKIAFASVYAMNPDIFLLDEPSSNLDGDSIRDLKNYLHILKQQGKTILIAEHRLYYLLDIADRIVYLADGKIEKIYTPQEFRSLSGATRKHMGLRTTGIQDVHPISYQRTFSRPILAVKDVSLFYKKHPVLEHISLQASKGDIIGVVGPNGAGKTTFLRTLCGLHKEFTGCFYWREQPQKETERMKRSYMVMQDVNHQLFCETVEEEVQLGMRSENAEEVERVLKQLDLSDLRDRHPMSLSGGQKQRLSIARAICRHPEILIFDDSFSALDYKTDRVLRDTLRKTCADATRFIVAQRIGTIRDADKIIVLDDGKIAGMGKHNELMETCEVYRQIAYSQLSKEELA